MSRVRILAKNTSILFLAQIITYILGFFYTIYLARYLGVENFGIISFSLALASIFSIIADFGLTTLSVREIARDKSIAKRFINNIFSIRVILSIITLVLVSVTIFFLQYSKNLSVIIYLIMLFTLFSGSFAGTFYSLFQAYEKMEYQSIGQILNSLLLLVGILVGIYLKFSLLELAIIYFVVGLILFAYSLLICAWKFFVPKLKFEFEFWKEILKEAFPLSLYNISSFLSFNIDSIILAFIVGTTAVGVYTASYRFLNILVVLPSVYVMSVFPVLSDFYISSKNSLKITYETSLKYLLLIAIPIAIITTLTSKDIINIIYGNSFDASIICLQILIWSVPLLFITYVFRVLLISINKQYLLLKITIVAMLINIILNFIFIPKYSFVAASIITVLTEFIIFILGYHFISKFFFKINIIKITWKPLLASLFMVMILSELKIGIYFTFTLFLVGYVIMLFVLRTFTKKDLNLFKKLIKI